MRQPSASLTRFFRLLRRLRSQRRTRETAEAHSDLAQLDLAAAAVSIAAVYRHLDYDSSALQPDESLTALYASRGREQWVYGEVTGIAALLTLLLSVPSALGVALHLCDIGSGTGRLVAFAALAGLRSTGVELVPQRHAVAVRAHEQLRQHDAGAASRCAFRCEDALASTAEPLTGVTHVLCNNAVWPDALNAQVARHVMAQARELVALAMLKQLDTAALEDAGLVLTRRSAVGVSWDPMGWPLYIYRPAHAVGNIGAPVQTDDAFFVAEESRMGSAANGMC